MGADWDEGIAAGRTVGEAFRGMADDRAYEYGHGGYTGTFAEKPGAALLGTLPARVTFSGFVAAAQNFQEWTEYGVWVESLYTTVEVESTNYLGKTEMVKRRKFDRDVKHRKSPLPKPLNNPAGIKMVKVWLGVTDDKWEPAACVELNAQETKLARGSYLKGRKGIHVYGFAGYCSS